MRNSPCNALVYIFVFISAGGILPFQLVSRCNAIAQDEAPSSLEYADADAASEAEMSNADDTYTFDYIAGLESVQIYSARGFLCMGIFFAMGLSVGLYIGLVHRRRARQTA